MKIVTLIIPVQLMLIVLIISNASAHHFASIDHIRAICSMNIISRARPLAIVRPRLIMILRMLMIGKRGRLDNRIARWSIVIIIISIRGQPVLPVSLHGVCYNLVRLHVARLEVSGQGQHEPHDRLQVAVDNLARRRRMHLDRAGVHEAQNALHILPVLVQALRLHVDLAAGG